jgi:tyrosinase
MSKPKKTKTTKTSKAKAARPARPKSSKQPFARLSRAEASGRERVVTKELVAHAAGPTHRYVRADLELRGVRHTGASFEVRVFINNRKATRDTAKTEANGYAGSAWVFGHGRCYGDPGHCHVPAAYRAEDRRRGHPLTPVDLHVDVYQAVRAAVETSDRLWVTLVPVVQAANAACELEDVLQFDALALITHNYH